MITDHGNFLHITKAQARQFLLAYQGLGATHEFQGKGGILAYLQRVGCIQFDPLDVAGQNAELVLQARISDFRRPLLKELLYEDRKLLDGWDKVISIYRVEDWPYFHRWREAARAHRGNSTEAIHAALSYVRAEIQERGPLSSLDLGLTEIVDWDWSHSRLSRAALESMYYWGELVVHHRVHTRKVYDFAHRCLPDELLQAPDPNPTDESYQEWHVHRRIGSVGLLWNRSAEVWLGITGVNSQKRKAAIERLLDQGRIVPVQIDGIGEPFYLHTQNHPYFEAGIEPDLHPARAILMAPLDNLLWDRRFLKELFDFDYRWEVYVPAGKRRYGYYVLPILYGDRFIARFEPVRDKRRGVLTIKGWWWEPEVTPDEPMKLALQKCFRNFLRYLELTRLELAPQAQERANLDWLIAASEIDS